MRLMYYETHVHPAKILQVCVHVWKGGLLFGLTFCMHLITQQEQVLTELYSHLNQDTPPPDAPSVNCTFRYLTACNFMFEKGFLSHSKVSSQETEVLSNIQKGFSFYSDWLSSILNEGIINMCPPLSLSPPLPLRSQFYSG